MNKFVIGLVILILVGFLGGLLITVNSNSGLYSLSSNQSPSKLNQVTVQTPSMTIKDKNLGLYFISDFNRIDINNNLRTWNLSQVVNNVSYKEDINEFIDINVDLNSMKVSGYNYTIKLSQGIVLNANKYNNVVVPIFGKQYKVLDINMQKDKNYGIFLVDDTNSYNRFSIIEHQPFINYNVNFVKSNNKIVAFVLTRVNSN